MSHITSFMIMHYDGHMQSIVGYPKTHRDKALVEIARLVLEEGYVASELQIVQVPN